MIQTGFKKLAADISPEELGRIDEAAKIQNRTRANFVRTVLKIESTKIIDDYKLNSNEAVSQN